MKDTIKFNLECDIDTLIKILKAIKKNEPKLYEVVRLEFLEHLEKIEK